MEVFVFSCDKLHKLLPKQNRQGILECNSFFNTVFARRESVRDADTVFLMMLLRRTRMLSSPRLFFIAILWTRGILLCSIVRCRKQLPNPCWSDWSSMRDPSLINRSSRRDSMIPSKTRWRCLYQTSLLFIVGIRSTSNHSMLQLFSDHRRYHQDHPSSSKSTEIRNGWTETHTTEKSFRWIRKDSEQSRPANS